MITRRGVEATLRVSIKADNEIMPAGRSGHAIVHALVVVGLIVAIEIVQPRDLVPSEDIELIVDNLHAERMV